MNRTMLYVIVDGLLRNPSTIKVTEITSSSTLYPPGSKMAKKQKEMKYELDLAYENGSKGIGLISEVDNDLYKALGYSESCGSGFGMRDHQYRFPDKETAAAAKKTVKEIFKKHHIRLPEGMGGAVVVHSYVKVRKVKNE